jgi:uracil-DNA glycosylase
VYEGKLAAAPTREPINAACCGAENLNMDAKIPIGRCDDCPFGHRCFVPGDGPRETNMVIVGQAPADTEVAQGRPFVGKSGA